MPKRELHKAVKRVIEAIENEGPSSGAHQRVLSQHRREWPTLHQALDDLRRAWHADVASLEDTPPDPERLEV